MEEDGKVPAVPEAPFLNPQKNSKLYEKNISLVSKIVFKKRSLWFPKFYL
jgi:hypothetical protein